ncbi:MAG TPA: cyclodeaminase/cyclohydrolase family protein [Actinomycetota bacterium]
MTNTAGQTVGGFLEALASDAPTPGGGAAAGVAGAAGAALISMVARLTMGKEAYASVDGRMRELAEQADAARLAFLDLADRDASAFDGVMAAFKMPKDTDEQKAVRSAAIQAGYEDAASVPLECLRKAVDTMSLAVEATADGNSQAASDGVSAAAELLCAALCAAANVEINAAALKDLAKREALLGEVASLRSRAEASLREAQDAFLVRLSS